MTDAVTLEPFKNDRSSDWRPDGAKKENFLVYAAALEMHPLDTEDRKDDLRTENGLGLCNITKCCTKVCPEGITITDNAIIPLKERVADGAYDPVGKLIQLVVGRSKD